MRSPAPPRRPRLARWLAAAAVAVCTAAGLTVLTAAPAAAVETDVWYRIVNDHSGLAVSIQNGSTTAGATAVLASPSNAADQQFRFVDSGGGHYRIQARHSNQVLDVYAKSTANGADVVQWADNNGANQQWQVNDQSDGSVELVNRNSGKALDNWAAATTPGSRVSQYDRNNRETQHWKLVPVESGGATGNGSLTDPNVQYYGRWNTADASWYTMGWAGGYVETAFTGSSIGVKLRGTIDMYYSIDGGAETWMRGVSGNATVRTGLSPGAHTIRIGFRERAGSYNGDPAFGGFLLAPGGSTAASARPANFIEFIGDSITVGQPNGDRPFTAYGYLVGDNLNAGHTQVAQGGACLVSQDCYGMMDWFRRSSAWVSGDDWDFSRYQATAVVINLGTNDVGHGVSGAQFQQNYIVMLERVRQAYPNAQIFAMETFRGRYSAETQAAVNARVGAGDAKVHFVDTTGWLPDSGDLVDSVHPSDQGHRKIANRLTPIIDQYI
ncbi:RICIN domain-containing protein [Glycomyces sp. TRM65418]|uniref:RICIN domain-containing protein n=1 Tax=Glycomyces sp. TRM65418 TaxID=2867006 RepID=UPI001CE4BA68|nr:RICIN domain-containing protein [Glycomyces sp. TRM65418]MCC3763552.1 RICIN domain-containing protein [Glycomyces sp. TRM65418]QZD57535.1 RICIN domain-containing protein [Glycomyces sp. TRM65418]